MIVCNCDEFNTNSMKAEKAYEKILNQLICKCGPALCSLAVLNFYSYFCNKRTDSAMGVIFYIKGAIVNMNKSSN